MGDLKFLVPGPGGILYRKECNCSASRRKDWKPNRVLGGAWLRDGVAKRGCKANAPLEKGRHREEMRDGRGAEEYLRVETPVWCEDWVFLLSGMPPHNCPHIESANWVSWQAGFRFACFGGERGVDLRVKILLWTSSIC